MKTKKYYETKEFQQLNKEWENKLKESGFSDIEDKDVRFSNLIRKENIEVCEKKENHFDLCREYLNNGEIKDELDLKIFTLYCEGFTVRGIEKKLKNTLKHVAISYRINKILEVING